METARIIKKLRLQSGLSQEELAGALYVSRELVSKWELGERRPDTVCVNKMAELFGVATDELIDKDEILMNELSECIPDGCDIPPEKIGQVISSFIRTLPERDGNVFIRRYYFMEDSSEIGHRYGLRQGAVRMILLRDRNKLKEYLGRYINEQ